jgi:hypothetical protein
MTDIRSQDMPASFFKYCKINQYSIDSIRNSTLWFSTSENLNDPFDLKYTLSDKLLTKTLTESSFDIYNDLNILLVEQGKNPLCHHFYENMLKVFLPDQQFRDYTVISLRENIKHSICCFTTTKDNHRMWSFYADNHKGMCLMYDFTSEASIMNSIFPVMYSDEYPVIEEAIDIVNVGAFKKKKEWSFEMEWRMTRIDEGSITIQPSSLKGIIFGAKCTPQSIQAMITECELQNRTGIELFKMTESPLDYKLLLSPLKIDGLNL